MMDDISKLFFTVLVALACPLCLPLLDYLEDNQDSTED